MAMHCHASVIAVSHLLRGTANLTLTSDDSWMISDLTQLNAIIVNDACLEMCDSRKCLFIFYWMGGSRVLWEVPSRPAMVTFFHMTKKNPCVRLTNSLKSVLRFLPSSRRRPAILFLILSDVQIIRPLIMARMYSVITRRWTSPTRTCNDNVNEIEWNELFKWTN